MGRRASWTQRSTWSRPRWRPSAAPCTRGLLLRGGGPPGVPFSPESKGASQLPVTDTKVDQRAAWSPFRDTQLPCDRPSRELRRDWRTSLERPGARFHVLSFPAGIAIMLWPLNL